MSAAHQFVPLALVIAGLFNACVDAADPAGARSAVALEQPQSSKLAGSVGGTFVHEQFHT